LDDEAFGLPFKESIVSNLGYSRDSLFKPDNWAGRYAGWTKEYFKIILISFV
jgi:hypothetical protein